MSKKAKKKKKKGKAAEDGFVLPPMFTTGDSSVTPALFAQVFNGAPVWMIGTPTQSEDEQAAKLQRQVEKWLEEMEWYAEDRALFK
jgi:hypothetical protein